MTRTGRGGHPDKVMGQIVSGTFVGTYISALDVQTDLAHSLLYQGQGDQFMKNQQGLSDIQKALDRNFPFYPIFDISEKDDHYVLCIDARAVLANEVDIELSGEELVIKGKGPYNSKKSIENLVVRSNGSNIAAQYKDGLLLVALKKNIHEKLSLLCA